MAVEQQTNESPQEPPSASETTPVSPRLWPGIVATAVVWIAMTVPVRLFPESPRGFMPLMFGLMGGLTLGTIWWVFASRTPWRDRLIGVALVGGGIALSFVGLLHPSMTGMQMAFKTAPWILTLAVGLLLLTRPLGWGVSRAVAATAIVAVFAAAATVRHLGADSGFQSTYAFRWEMSPEEKLVASLRAAEPPDQGPPADGMAAPATPIEAGEGDWPGFRGPARDGHLQANALAASWDTAPTEVWRHAVGPAYSSFCVVGGRAYTQEQLDDQECVVAYDASTGSRLWSTSVTARFDGPMAGPGPRATPTFFEGDVYATGGEGAVQRLNAATGEVIWRRELTADTARETPAEWGFCSSPLIVQQDNGPTLVVVYAGNPNPDPADTAIETNRGVIAYDADTGEPVWNQGAGYHSYSSAHLATLGGERQVLMSSNLGLESLDPATGEQLWFFDWDIATFARCIQPVVVDDKTVVLSAGYDSGTILIGVDKAGGAWSAREIWDGPSRELEPYFNDMVLFQGHLYGIHKTYLTCIDIETGKATWPRRVKRKSKLGNGQLVLDPASGMLLVTTETTGEVVLVEANPETLVIRGRFEALKPDTNWNHPVVAGGRLYVRNAVEAACFELPAPQVASRTH